MLLRTQLHLLATVVSHEIRQQKSMWPSNLIINEFKENILCLTSYFGGLLNLFFGLNFCCWHMDPLRLFISVMRCY